MVNKMDIIKILHKLGLYTKEEYYKLINNIDKLEEFSIQTTNEILSLDREIISLKEDISSLTQLNELANKDIDSLKKSLYKLRNKSKPTELEVYWNNKIKPVNMSHSCRYLPNSDKKINIDPRQFFNITGVNMLHQYGTNDEKAYKCLQSVKNRVTYTSDSQFKQSELWLFAWETYQLRKGDCEDGAILLANMMIKSGIPYWRIRINAGDVKGGGHAWVTYLRESDNKWVILDWCYWYNDSMKGLLWTDAEKYYDIWFSFNEKLIFVKPDLDRDD